MPSEVLNSSGCSRIFELIPSAPGGARPEETLIHQRSICDQAAQYGEFDPDCNLTPLIETVPFAPGVNRA
jgi:hypothetical protein